MDTTAFSTLYCKKRARLESHGATAVVLARRVLRLLALGCWCLWWAWLGLYSQPARAVDMAPAEVATLRVVRADDGLYLYASLNFELPAAVEEAMLKGVPITFVSEADVYRDRWYWYDKRVATATRSVRLAFQPLTRRWRINVASGTIASSPTGLTLAQNFDNLSDAIAAVRRIARWKIADVADVDIQARHNIDYRFKLDVSQLPRPLQIGVAGQTEWNINAARNVRPEAPVDSRPEPPAATR